MALQFERDEAVPAGVRRIAGELLDATAGLLAIGPAPISEKAVHDARTNLKQLRALLRLVRPAIGESVYARENVCYRDAGRRLAGARDAAVLLQTLEAVLDRLPADGDGPASTAAAKSLRTRLAQHAEAARQPMGEAQARAALLDARGRVASWPIAGQGFGLLKPGLRRTYQAARRDHRIACREASAEAFHEWRKQVKYLWYQMRLLEPVWPKAVKAYRSELKALSDLLGEDHDLVVLREALAALRCESDAESATLERLRAGIDQRRSKLQREAHPRGARLLAESSSAFARRWAAAWQAWREKGISD